MEKTSTQFSQLDDGALFTQPGVAGVWVKLPCDSHSGKNTARACDNGAPDTDEMCFTQHASNVFWLAEMPPRRKPRSTALSLKRKRKRALKVSKVPKAVQNFSIPLAHEGALTLTVSGDLLNMLLSEREFVFKIKLMLEEHAKSRREELEKDGAP